MTLTSDLLHFTFVTTCCLWKTVCDPCSIAHESGSMTDYWQ